MEKVLSEGSRGDPGKGRKVVVRGLWQGPRLDWQTLNSFPTFPKSLSLGVGGTGKATLFNLASWQGRCVWGPDFWPLLLVQ